MTPTFQTASTEPAAEIYHAIVRDEEAVDAEGALDEVVEALRQRRTNVSAN